MEQGKKIHFFCSKGRRRIDIAIQTENSAFFFLRNREKDSNLYDNFHNSCEDSILTQSSTHQITQIDTLFINKIRSKVAFNVSILKDDRFDALSLPDDSDDNRFSMKSCSQSLDSDQKCFCSPDLYFEFNEYDFSILNLETSTSCKYAYNASSYHLFSSLETGFITDHFFESIDINISNNIKYQNGFCICDVTDFRFKPHIHKRIKLQIHQCNLTKYLNFVLSSKSNLKKFVSNNKRKTTNKAKDDSDEDQVDRKININGITDKDLHEIKIRAERKLLLKFHPVFCTDPSPDVARVQSIYDFRSKMWHQNCQDQFYMNFLSSPFSSFSQRANYSNDERPSFGRIPSIEIKDIKTRKQIYLPSSIRSCFPNFDAPLDHFPRDPH